MLETRSVVDRLCLPESNHSRYPPFLVMLVPLFGLRTLLPRVDSILIGSTLR